MEGADGQGTGGLWLVTVSGEDAIGASATLFRVLGDAGVTLLDAEQVTIAGQLVLSCLVSAAHGTELLDTQGAELLDTAGAALHPLGLRVSAERHDHEVLRPARDRLHVTLLAETLTPQHFAAVAGAVSKAGANIDRVAQLARFPLSAYELQTSGGDISALRLRLSALGPELAIDVAVQDDSIHRRAKRLIVLDVDSTLVQGEVIDELAARAGVAAQVATITTRAMHGELDFAASLRARVALLAGLPEAVLTEVAAGLTLMPGARTLVTTLKHLGYAVGIVSGGFTFATDRLRRELDLDHAEANVLELLDGRLTGRVLPPVVDRAGKADALRRFCAAFGVETTQAVAVGDGANDLDMLAAAGLGIAFNAKPVVRREADVSLSSPYLDAVLFLLGLSEAEIAALG